MLFNNVLVPSPGSLSFYYIEFSTLNAYQSSSPFRGFYLSTITYNANGGTGNTFSSPFRSLYLSTKVGTDSNTMKVKFSSPFRGLYLSTLMTLI